MYTAVKKESKSTPKPKLMFAHSEEDCSGSAIQVELHPATLERPGSLMLEFADQTDPGYVDSDGYHNGGFNWAGSLKFRLKLAKVGKFLRLMNGNLSTSQPMQIPRKTDAVYLWCDRETDDSDADGVSILLTAIVDNTTEWTFRLRPEEAEVLRLAIEGAMPKLAWGN